MTPQLSDDDPILIEELIDVQFLSSHRDGRLCVLEMRSNCGPRFYELTRDQVRAMGEWLLTSAGGAVGRA